MLITISTDHEWVNDGSWHSFSALDQAISKGRLAFWEAGGEHWTLLEVRTLPCDKPSVHRPNSCEHYKVWVTGNKREAA